MSVRDFEMEMCCSMQVRSLIHELELCKQVSDTQETTVIENFPDIDACLEWLKSDGKSYYIASKL